MKFANVINSIPLPEVRLVEGDFKAVYENSELLLKHRHPGVVGIRRLTSGLWTGTVISEKGESK